VVHGEAEDTVDFLAMADIAGKGQSSITVADASSSGFEAIEVTRQHDDGRTLTREQFRKRLANAHRSASNDGNFAGYVHALLVLR
jgi:uncharacterized protein YcfJ